MCADVLCFGTCATACGGVVAAENETGTVTLEGEGTEKSPYKIGTYDELVKFANIVNKGETDVWAVLTANIVANKDLLNTDGKLKNNNPENTWIPICHSLSNGYSGTFDGKGHTISGLYFNDKNATYNVGLFSNNGRGTIRNVGVIDSYFNTSESVGGVCGYNNGGEIYNCYNTGTVTGAGDYTSVGGVCGNNNNGTIENCYNTGTVTGTGTEAKVGGVCGYNNNGTIENCYNKGTVPGTVTGTEANAKVGGVCGYNLGSIYNCYYLAGIANKGIGYGNGSATSATEKEVGDFNSGKVAWLLNGNDDYTSVGEDKTSPWLQNLDGDKKDDYPVLTTKVNKCIAVKKVGDSYSNFGDNHSYDNATLAAYPEAGTYNLYSQVCDHCKYAATALPDQKVIERLNGDDNIVIKNNNDAWQAEKPIILSDEANYNAPIDFIAKGGASYSREISTQWATLCLPFDIKAETTDYKTYNLSVVGDTQITLTEITGENAIVKAGTPVFVKRTGTTTTVKFDAVAIDSKITMMKTPEGSSCKDDKGLTGVFTETWLSKKSNNLFIKNDYMWDMTQSGKSMKVKPFRAYISKGANGAPQRSIVVDGEATAISDALNTLNDANAEYYDMSGRRINSLQKGVNIVKSGNKTRKVIIK